MRASALPRPFLRKALSSSTLLYVVKSDIADLHADVIVSSDDSWLSMAGGVSARIANRGGPPIWERIHVQSGKPFQQGDRATIGEVFESKPGALHAARIFQVAVVDWENDILPTKDIIRGVSSKLIHLARERWKTDHEPGDVGTSIALPLMGSGAGGLSLYNSLAAIVEATVEASVEQALAIDVVVCLPPQDGLADRLPEQVATILQQALGPKQPEVLDEPGVASSPMLRRQASDAAERGEDADSFISWLPAPIAVPMFAARQHSRGWERFSNALQTADSFVRLLACFALASDLPATRPDRLRQVLSIFGERPPTLGTWVRVLREHIANLRSVDRAFVDPLVSPSGKRSTLGMFLFERLSEIRNTYAHGTPPPDEVFVDLLPEVLEPLRLVARDFNALRSYQLMSPTSFDWGEGDKVRYVLRALHGPYAVFPTVIRETDQRLVTKHVYLTEDDPNGHLWLDLDPLVIFSVCPTCQRDDIFLYDRGSQTEVEFISSISGHRKLVKFGAKISST